MKRFILCCALISASTLAITAQVEVGLRNNRYIHAGYLFRGHWGAEVEHSVFSETIGYQYVRIGAGYVNNVRGLAFTLAPFWGTTWNGFFWNCGAFAGARYRLPQGMRWLGVNAMVNPRYDSTIHYDTCWLAGLDFYVNSEICLVADYTTVPQYRVSEKLWRFGVRFTSGRLSVTPRVTMPADGRDRNTHLQTLVDFSYQF
ncbi:MAG: hypothetical protein LIP02_07735 [Bacteroidales bacterium]|nr:hypothetical protein [Bacteroidales bacterium]